MKNEFEIEFDEIDMIDACLEMQDALNDRETEFLEKVRNIHESGVELSGAHVEKIKAIYLRVQNYE